MTATQLSREPVDPEKTPRPQASSALSTSVKEKGSEEKGEEEEEVVDEKKLLRKIDFALIPWLSFLYLLSFLDRTSIGK